MAILLAMMSTVSIAAGEFFAAGVAKRTKANEVTSMMFVAGVVLTGIVAVFWPGDPTRRDLLFGGLAGASNGVVILLLYVAYSRGSLRSAAPVAAVVMSGVPIAWDVLISGSSPSGTAWAGILLGVAAIALSSYAPGESGIRSEGIAMITGFNLLVQAGASWTVARLPGSDRYGRAMTTNELDVDDVARAAERLAGVAHITPELTSRTLDERTSASVRLKAECFQRTGSFKFRGAYNAVASLPESIRRSGVVTFSSGNHGQAIALAAKLHGIPAVIVMPHDAPSAKREAAIGYGAEIVGYDRYLQSREAIGDTLAADRGLTLIPPFDSWDVMAGQGTLARELFASEPADAIVACVGGGGLISGCATIAKAHGDVRVIGVEPEASDDVQRSLAEGRRVTLDTPPVTIADGQQTTSCGDKTFAVIRELVDEVALVTDAEIVAAMRFAFERLNIVLEPSGASALAGVMSGRLDLEGQRVGVTLSGGNVDLARFAALTAE